MSDLTMNQELDSALNAESVVDNVDNLDSVETPKPGLGIDLSFLMKDTGDGEIEEYITHPLNFKKSLGYAQLLRGLTGIAGTSLKKAIVDILMGIFRIQRENKKVNADVPINQGVSNGVGEY